MECPTCKVNIKFDSNTSVKWSNIWGGKVKCQGCSSWLQRSKQASTLLNIPSVFAALGMPFLGYYFSSNPYALVTCGVMIVAILFVGITQKWVVCDSAQNT
jgi:hypothetical protein